MKRYEILFGMVLILGACAEKPTKLVIDPPAGAGPEAKITFESEDRASGKNEKVTIPVPQIPQRLVIDQPAGKAGGVTPSKFSSNIVAVPAQIVCRMESPKMITNAIDGMVPRFTTNRGQPIS